MKSSYYKAISGFSIFVVLQTCLSGCTFIMETRADRQIKVASKICSAIGFRPNTRTYKRCMLRILTPDSACNSPNGVATGSRTVTVKDEGSSFMCKQAIKRGDGGGIDIFC